MTSSTATTTGGGGRRSNYRHHGSCLAILIMVENIFLSVTIAASGVPLNSAGSASASSSASLAQHSTFNGTGFSTSSSPASQFVLGCVVKTIFVLWLIAPNASTSYVLLPITKVLKLPPPSSLARTLRPYVFPVMFVMLSISRVRWGDGDASTAITMDHPSAYDWLLFAEEKVRNRGVFDIILHFFCQAMESFSNILSRHNFSNVYYLVLNDMVGLLLIQTLFQLHSCVHNTSVSSIRAAIVEYMYEWSKVHVPQVQRTLDKAEEEMRTEIEHSLKDPNRQRTLVLPREGRDPEDIIQKMTEHAKREDAKWKSGRVSGAVYSGEQSHTQLLNDAYAAYTLSNPLHTDLWPSINQYEAEVCSMTASLVNGGDDNVVGCVTSGGTESIVLAVKAHREYYRKHKGVRSHPQIISCVTAHAGLEKACEMLGIRNVQLPFDTETYTLRPSDVERCITSNTILIYASAPSFPQGVIDPVQQLSDLALKHGVGLHVDCCLGGFILPFARDASKGLRKDAIPEFDFGCKGVTSMSCDTHKYGYASKGTSVVLYRNKALRRAQYFCYPKWTGGLYATPSIAGSRSGALIASAWASMVSIGYDGYTRRTQSILETTRKIAKCIQCIEGLELLPRNSVPQAMIVCFTSTEFDIYRVSDVMSKTKGWSLNSLQNPPCIHLCVTLKTVEHADLFIRELKEVVQDIRKEEKEIGDEGQGKRNKGGGNAAMYGMAGTLPPGPINELLQCYTDVVLTP